MTGRFSAKLIVSVITLCLLFSHFCLFQSEALALSIEEEKVMGQEFLAQIKGRFQFLDDDCTNQFINDLGQYLITPLETKHFPFHFYIIKDNTLNAFAAPGGHIFIFSGLIGCMDGIDELAAVMCHEIGHVSARHLAQRLEQSKIISIATMAGMLAGILIGGEAAGAMMTGSVAAAMQTRLHYSRTDERQADQLGFKYMKSAGFDPGGMITALKKIRRANWLGTDKVPAYLLTHPAGPERMSNLDTMLSNYAPESPKNEAVGFRSLFPFFKTIVQARSLEPHDAERLFNLELNKAPSSVLANFGMGIACMGNSEYALAIRHFKKSLAGEPNFIPLLTNLGEAYQMNGQNKEAISVLEQALKLDEGDKSTLFLLGLSYENLGQYQKAIPFFERLAAYKPVKNDVFYHLGISYGRCNRLALAHYYFGLHFKELGEIKKSRFHFRKADEFCENDQSLKVKIQKAMK